MSIEEVRSLVAERQRYDDWLAALDARQAETPERVFQRVRADYDARRNDVLTQLAEHVAELEMLTGNLRQQHADLSAQLETLDDQRVEAMIRNAVGEYDNDKWDALRTDLEGQIGKLGDDRTLVQMELDEIHGLLEQARPAGWTPPVEVAAPATDAAQEAPAEPEPVALEAGHEFVSAQPTEAVVADASVAHSGLVDEAPRVESAVELSADTVEMAVFTAPEPSPSPDVEMPPVTAIDSLRETVGELIIESPDVAAMAMPAGNEVEDALAMFAETPAQPMPAIPAPPEAYGDVLGVELTPAPGGPHTGGTTAPPIDAFDDLAFLHSVIAPSGGQPAVPAATMTPPSVPAHQGGGAAPGQVGAAGTEPGKTLRCTECGTMNLPTEWYCERCGGELAAF